MIKWPLMNSILFPPQKNDPAFQPPDWNELKKAYFDFFFLFSLLKNPKSDAIIRQACLQNELRESVLERKRAPPSFPAKCACCHLLRNAFTLFYCYYNPFQAVRSFNNCVHCRYC